MADHNKIEVTVTADKTEEFEGKNLSASIDEREYGSRLIIKKDYDVIAMFNEWLYWRYIDEEEE